MKCMHATIRMWQLKTQDPLIKEEYLQFQHCSLLKCVKSNMFKFSLTAKHVLSCK